MEKIKRRLFELDALRGIAALLVVLFHYTTKYGEIFETDSTTVIEFSFGHFGVQLFFVISGFVIFLTIQNIKTGVEFIKKRFIRLYPTFWLCLFITFMVTSVAGIERFERSWQELIINITMLPDLFRVRMIDGVYWSLLPEIIFYILILICFKFKLLKKIELISYLWLVICIVIIHLIKNNALILLSLAFYCHLFIAGINFYQ